MEIRKKIRQVNLISLLFLTIILFAAKGSFAETYSYDFTGQLKIWDVSGTFADDELGCSTYITMNQDNDGKITGSGSAVCNIEGVDIDMTYNVNGAIKQSNNTANIKLSIKFKGTAEFEGKTYNFSASEKINAEISGQTMTGTVKVKASVAGEKVSETLDFNQSLPYDMDGSFNISFDAVRTGKLLIGNGTLELSNGEQYSFDVTGKANDKTGQSKFSLKGDVIKLKLIIESDNSINSMKGKAFGQKIVK